MRKLAHLFGILFLAVAAFLVLLVVAFGTAQTSFGKKQLALILSRALSSTNIETHVDKIEGIVPFRFKIGKVTSRQNGATWLAASNINCSISPTLQRPPFAKLPRIVIRVNKLSVGQAHILGIPQWHRRSTFNIIGFWPTLAAQNLGIEKLTLPTSTNSLGFRLHASLTADSESWRLSLNCNDRGTNSWCESRLNFLVGSQTIEGNIDGHISELGEFIGLLQGSLETKIKFANIGKNQTIAAFIQANNLRTDSACLAKLSIQADISDAWRVPAGQVQVAINDLVQGKVYLHQATVALSGSPQALVLQTELNGQLYGLPFGSTANAQGYVASDQTGSMTINDFQGFYADQIFALNSPENIAWGNNHCKWDKTKLQIGTNGYIETQGEISTQEVVVAFKSFLPFSVSSILGQSQLAGSATLDFLLQGSPLHPNGKATFHAQTDTPMILPGLKKAPWTADITATLDQNNLDIAANSRGIEELSVSCQASLPVELNLRPFLCSIISTQELSAKLQANLDFGALAPLFASNQQYLQGQLEAVATLAGTWLHPSLHGHATMTNALYQHLISGTVIDRANINLEASNEYIQIKEAQATDGLNGNLTASGRLKFDPTEKFPFSFTLCATNASLVRMDYNNAKLNGILQVTGSVQNINVTGVIDILEANINIPRALPPSITPISVNKINAPIKYLAPLPSKREGAAEKIDLLLTINAPGHVYIKGRGLYSEWAGNFSIEGQIDKPLVRGQLAVIDGYFMFLGKKLNLQQCAVSLDGFYPLTPQININAQTEIDNMVANLQIIGSITDPELTISSTPTYPPQEILARLLFGKSLSEVTPLETVRILYGLAIIQGGNPLTTTIDKAQGLLHVDQIGLTQAKHDNQPAMIVSKNFGRFQIAGTTSLRGTNTDVQVSYDITPSLQAEATAGLDSGNGLYFRWHRDY